MTVIANDIQGVHPLFAGIEDPVDVDAPDSPWAVLAERNPRQAILQANFGAGQVLTMRVSSTEEPMKKVGNAAVFRPGPNMMARWETHSTHVKLLVEFDGPPADPALSVALTKAGVATAIDPDTGEVTITANGERVGGLPRPWIEYMADDGSPDELSGTVPRTRLFLDWTLDGNTLSVAYPALSDTEWVGALLDPTVITTSTASTATAYSNQRKIDRCQNGVLWAMYWDGTSTTTNSMRFRYSTNDGATWTDAGGFGFAGTGTAYVPNGSLFIDLDDYAHVVYKDRSNGYIYYRRGTPNAARTAWTWSAAYSLVGSGAGAVRQDYADIIAHREGTGWAAHAVFSYNDGSSAQTEYSRVTITSAGGISVAVSRTYLGGGTGGVHTYPSIDFNHTGDGKTVKDGTPHLYVAWSAGATGAGKGIRFKKATYSGGAWTWGTEREIDSTKYISSVDRWGACLFDGVRVVIGGTFQSSTGASLQHMLYERDATDTATVTRVLGTSTNFVNVPMSGSFAYDANGNVYFFGVEDGAAAPMYLWKWDRASATRQTKVLINSGQSRYASAKRGYSNNRIELIYTDGTASPYSVTYDAFNLNTAPDAPTLTSPVDGSTLNRQQDQVFTWQFNDSNPGDSQSAYNFAYRPVGAATWTETGWVAVTSSQHIVPANTFAEGLHEWRVATKDQAGAESPWSVTRTFTAYKAATGTGLAQGTPQLSASGVVAYHLDGVGVISVAHTRSAQGIKSTAGTGLAEQDVLPVLSSGLRASRGTVTIEAEPFVGIFTSGIGSGALLVTATPLAGGTRQTQGDGLLYVTDVPTGTGYKWQRYFTPPGREVYGSGNRFWRRVHIEQGITIIKRDGAFIQVEHPSPDDFANADKIYIGGHLYQIDDLEYLDLEAAGYTTFYSEDGR